MSAKLQHAKDEMILSTMEQLVPEDHLVRKLDKHISFGFIRELTKPYYSDMGRPGYNPVILFKIAFIKSVFGISSIRRTVEEIKINIAYRWFIGIPFSESIPEHSTYSKNYTLRFMNTDVYNQIFENILSQAIDAELISYTNINIDSTNIKASANKKKYIEKYIKNEKSVFEDEMLEYINEQRKNDEDKPLPPSAPKGNKRTKESNTDKDSGWLNKGEKEKNFSYNAHTSCDKHGYILNAKIKPSNIHDSKVFNEVYNDLVKSHGNEITTVAIDAGYYSGPLIKRIFDNAHLPLLPRKKMVKSKYELLNVLRYNEEGNYYLHENGTTYNYKSTNRQGYKLYKNEEKKELRISIYQPYLDLVKNLRLSKYGSEVYGKRKETIERVFADFKERHFGRYTHYRGLKKVSDHILLIFASMNMKKMANALSRRDKNNTPITNILIKIRQFIQRKRPNSKLNLVSL